MFKMRRPKEPQYCNSAHRSMTVSMRRELLDLCSRYLMAGKPSLTGTNVHELEGIMLKVKTVNREYSEFGEPLLDLDKSEAQKTGKQINRMGRLVRHISVVGLFAVYFTDSGMATAIPFLIGIPYGAAVSFYSKLFTLVEKCDSVAALMLAEAKRLGEATLPEIQRRALEFYEMHARDQLAE